MGCGGSKKEVLEGCEKPLCHRMEKIEIDSIDSVFDKCSNIIVQVEEKRKFLVDELMENCLHTGAYAHKNPNPKNGMECAIWRLGVDNKGNVSEIGLNVENMCFEGSNNSQKGNDAANNLIGYFKCLSQNWKMEDMTALSEELAGCVKEVSDNMENYMNEVKEKYSSEPFKMASAGSNLKCNLSKTQCACTCVKELCEKMQKLMAIAPELMAMCTPEKMKEQQASIDAAVKSKQTENLPIAFHVFPADQRRAKTCKGVEDIYNEKVKCRKEILAKIASA